MNRLNPLKALVMVAFALQAHGAAAQATEQVATDKVFGTYRVVFSAFNSSFIKPDIAAQHNISRGRNRGLVNIALIDDDATTGRAALVEGSVTDLMSRQQTLDFFEVREGAAVYYLAPFDFTHQDALSFRIHVRADADGEVMPVTFRRTFYRD